MTYNQQVMHKAHELYRANGGGSRDLFAACLSIAHRMLKAKFQREATAAWMALYRRQRVLNNTGPMEVSA